MGGHTVGLHRLVVEADMNGLSIEDFLKQLRQGHTQHLLFLDPATWAVHHKDHDPRNNDLGNLEVLSHHDHAVRHADEGTTSNVQVRITTEQVVSVERHGEEETYDLEVEDDPHNFLANGFVVHNTGKTLFLCNLAYQMRQHRVLFLSLEMTREEIYDRLRRIYLFHNPRDTDTDIDEGLANIYICDENRLLERDIAGLVSEFAVEADGPPDVVFVDYLGYFARGAKGQTPYEKTTQAVMNLKAEAKAGRFVVITPSQVNRLAKEGKPVDLDDARDSGAVEETADFLLALYRPDEALNADGDRSQPLSGKLRLSILKSRHGGKGNVMSLQMDNLTLAIVNDATPEANRATHHNMLATRGLDWEALRRRELAPEQLTMNGVDHA